MDNEVIVAVDIGDHKVCVLVGEAPPQDSLRVIGVGATPSHGVKRGMVVSMDELAHTVTAAVERAERVSGYEIHRAEVSIAGSHISSVNSRGVVAVAHSDHQITEQDVARALEAARAVPMVSNREVMHVIPRYFIVDGQEGVPNPVGMYGFRLEVEAHIITASSLALQNLQRTLAQSGIDAREMVAAPLAAAEAVLTQDEKDMGVIVADIGGGTTGLCIYSEGTPFYTTVLKVGGMHITNDLTVGLRLPFNVAEDIKVRYGHALSSMVDPQETIEVPGTGQENRTVSRLRECEIIEDRVAEIFHMILNEVKKSGHDGLLPGGVVLTGGGAELPGMAEMGREIVGLNVRVGTAQGIGGVVDTISSPAYACSVGLLKWGLTHDEETGEEHESGGSLWKKFREFLESAFSRLGRAFGSRG